MQDHKVVQLPCLVGSLNSLGSAGDHILVKLLVPNNGTAAWANKDHVTLVEQSAAGQGELRAKLRSTLIHEGHDAYVVEIVDRDTPLRLQIPKEWLREEPGAPV